MLYLADGETEDLEELSSVLTIKLLNLFLSLYSKLCKYKISLFYS
jgi:hypothetical protein